MEFTEINPHKTGHNNPLQQVNIIHDIGYTCDHSQPHDFIGIKDITGNYLSST